MTFSSARRHLQAFLRHHLVDSPSIAEKMSTDGVATAAAAHATRRSARRARPRTYVYQQRYGRVRPGSTTIEVARFGLLSVATLPFTIWIGCFTYDYVYRVDICRDALTKEDSDLTTSQMHFKENNRSGKNHTLLGRDRELAEVGSLLEKEPNQIIVIAGGNEAGKSRFVTELLLSEHVHSGRKGKKQKKDGSRGVIFVQLAQLVDSVSSFTSVLVNAFDLRWLRLRHSLVDVLPFAGSEILVMKERFSDRDLAQALAVVTEALKRHVSTSAPSTPKPVIVIDGLGEGTGSWMRSAEGQLVTLRFLQWCIYVTKERRLAHIVLTGNEQLVLSLTDQNRLTRGHIRIVGLGDLDLDDAAEVVRRELPDASAKEIEKVTGVFGGFVHDLHGVGRDIRYRLEHEDSGTGDNRREKIIDEVIKARFQQQVERVTAAFARGKENNDAGDRANASEESNDDMDPFLDRLKLVYSEAQAEQATTQKGDVLSHDNATGWTQLQLWKTLQLLVQSENMEVSFSELRDDVFDGNMDPILELMREDVLGFEVSRSSDGGWLWRVTPASTSLGRAFEHLVKDGSLKERFHQIELDEARTEKMDNIESERVRLNRDRRSLDLRKRSLMKTVELGKELGREDLARRKLALVFDDIVSEELEQEEQDRILRQKLASLSRMADKNDSPGGDEEIDDSVKDHSSIQSLLKGAVLKIVSGQDSATETTDKFSRLREAFRVMDAANDGMITAADLARAVKATTGKEIDIDAARLLVRKWDRNDDKTLDYNEFLLMLLTDEDDKKRSQK